VVTPERDLLLALYSGDTNEDNACIWCASDGGGIPNSSIQNPTEPGGTRSITAQVAADSPAFHVWLVSFDYDPAPIDVAFRMFVNGQVVRQWTTTFTHGTPLVFQDMRMVTAYPCSGKEPPCTQ
jgi:hypothetical protein